MIPNSGTTFELAAGRWRRRRKAAAERRQSIEGAERVIRPGRRQVWRRR